MAWTGARKLILPAALTVTTFATVGIVMACGGDDENTKKKAEASVKCTDEPAGACELCLDGTGKTTCGPSKDCYIDVNNECHAGGSS